jgi:hypothetical protein
MFFQRVRKLFVCFELRDLRKKGVRKLLARRDLQRCLLRELFFVLGFEKQNDLIREDKFSTWAGYQRLLFEEIDLRGVAEFCG